jgi:hypothetical protein
MGIDASIIWGKHPIVWYTLDSFSPVERGFSMQLEWWYWILAGFCLIGLELIVPSFTMIWFGMGALLVGIFKAIWPGFSVVGQIFLWSISSIWFTTLWFKYLKNRSSRWETRSG